MSKFFGRSGLRGLRRQQTEAVRRLYTLCASTVSAPPKKQESVRVQTVSYILTDLEIRAMSKLRTGKLNHGDRVEVYRNLHNNTFSIRRDGKVVKHLENWMTLYLQDVKFAVQPAGREKVRREGKNNVHAYVRGTVIKAEEHHLKETFKEKCVEWVTYNPYQDDTFTATVTDPETTFTSYQPVHKARLVILKQGYVYAAL